MYKKLLSIMLTITLCMINFTVVLAEQTPVSVTPVTGSSNVSVVADVDVDYGIEISEEMFSSAQVSVTPSAAYETIKDGNKIKVRFNEALEYETEYTVTVDGVSTTFTTEADSFNVLYSENFDNDTIGEMPSSMSWYGPESTAGAATVKSSWLSDKQNALHFADGANSKFATDYVTTYNAGPGRVAINGSENWSDIEIDYDFGLGIATAPIMSAVMFRMNEENEVYNGGTAEILVEPIGSTNKYRAILNSAVVKDSARSASWGAGEYSTVYSELPSDMLYYEKFHMNVKVQGDGWVSTVTDKATGTVLATAQKDTAGMPASGAVVFGANHGFNTFDNIVIRDIGFGCTPENRKIGTTLVLNFSEAIDETTVSDSKFTVTGENSNVVDSEVSFVDAAKGQVVLTLNGAENGIYNVKVDKSIATASGTQMAADKNFTVSVYRQISDKPISVLPATGAEDVSVFEDVYVYYEMPVTAEMISNAAVSVEPAAEYTLVSAGNAMIIRFNDILESGTEYTVSCNGIETVFKTAENNSDILYSEDFTDDTVGAMPSSMSWYGPESTAGAATVKSSWLSGSQNALHFADGANSKFATDYVTTYNAGPGRVAINGSENWSDIEIDYDFGVGIANTSIMSAVMFRMNEENEVYNGGAAEILVEPNGSTNKYRAILNSAGVKDSARSAAWGAGEYSTVYSEFPSDMLYYEKFHMNVKVQGDGWVSTVTNNVTGEVLATAQKDAAGMPASGAVVFGANHGFNTFDNIVIRDIGFGCKPQQSKNIQNKVVLDFDEVLNPSTFSSDKIKVMRDGQEVSGVSSAITGTQGKQITVTIPNATDGYYTVTVDKSIGNRKGITMAKDKSFEVLVSMPYSFESFNISDLAAGNSVTASVKVNHNSTSAQEYTFILAVYTREGFLYDVSYDTVTLSYPTDRYKLSAESDALPQEISGYTASVFVIDNLNNITPLSSKITK